jgi:hypothetical protein
MPQTTRKAPGPPPEGNLAPGGGLSPPSGSTRAGRVITQYEPMIDRMAIRSLPLYDHQN